MNHRCWRLCSLWSWLIGLMLFLVWASVLILYSFFRRDHRFESLLKRACRSILRGSGIRIIGEGFEGIRLDRPYVIMMNHVNMFDPLVLYGIFPAKARGMEEQSHFTWPVYGWLNRRIGNIPVNRKNARQAIGSLKRAAKLISENDDCSVVVLPEGTRTLDGRIGPFKKGGFLLALEAGVDILPVIQVGAFERKHKGDWVINRGTVSVIAESPIAVDRYTRESLPELIQRVRSVFLRYVSGR